MNGYAIEAQVNLTTFWLTQEVEGRIVEPRTTYVSTRFAICVV